MLTITHQVQFNQMHYLCQLLHNIGTGKVKTTGWVECYYDTAMNHLAKSGFILQLCIPTSGPMEWKLFNETQYNDRFQTTMTNVIEQCEIERQIKSIVGHHSLRCTMVLEVTREAHVTENLGTVHFDAVHMKNIGHFAITSTDSRRAFSMLVSNDRDIIGTQSTRYSIASQLLIDSKSFVTQRSPFVWEVSSIDVLLRSIGNYLHLDDTCMNRQDIDNYKCGLLTYILMTRGSNKHKDFVNANGQSFVDHVDNACGQFKQHILASSSAK